MADNQDWRKQEEQWLNFTQGYTGNGQVSRGGSTGGFVPGGGQYRSDRGGSLQPVLDAYNKQYGTSASMGGSKGDKVDFGDGRGPVDVITGGGDFWYAEPGGSADHASGGTPSAGGQPGAGMPPPSVPPPQMPGENIMHLMAPEAQVNSNFSEGTPLMQQLMQRKMAQGQAEQPAGQGDYWGQVKSGIVG